MPRFNLGEFQKRKKQVKHETIEATKAIRETKTELIHAEQELNKLRKDLKCKTELHRRLDEKVEKVVRKVEELEEIEEELVSPSKRQKCNIRRPTELQEDGKLNISDSEARRRRNKVYDAAKEIHGSESLSVDAGLADTIVHKCNFDTVKTIFKSSSSFTKKFISSVQKNPTAEYEKSQANLLRSVATYYSGGIMGKNKYRSVYKANSYVKSKRISVSNSLIPRLVPYHKLMPFIKSIDIGKLYSVKETLCEGLDEEHKVNGVYRNLKDLLFLLAKFYLEQGIYELTWFNGQENSFFVNVGGDGAPFGKDDVSTAWLVSFLNLGRGVLSSNENFLLFGANCTEDSVPVQRFISLIGKQITEIEKETYSIIVNNSAISVKFYFAELPNDMKMLATLGGELPNSAKYFSTFANVSYDDLGNCSGSFSYDSQTSTWSPWKYTDRLKVAGEVAKLKVGLAKKKLAPSTVRTKITTFIANKKSRQEFPPLLGELIDRAHVEPLHLKNNACALAHRLLLYEVVYMSDLPETITFSMVPAHSPLAKYVAAMHSCKLGRLAKRIIRWFDETRSASTKSMDYRFTGKESKLFLHSFNVLISSVISSAVAGQRQKVILHIISYMCLCLRDCVSLFNRLELNEEQVSELKTLCHHYFVLHAMFLNSVTPTVWHIGYVVPVHLQDMLSKYGMGLLLNSMEGREAKHISIANYSKNTTMKCRWEQVFLHEYVSLIWLRERGYNRNTKKAPTSSYVPKRVEDPSYCNCGLQKDEDGNCSICSHPYREKIKQCIQTGKSLFGEVKLNAK